MGRFLTHADHASKNRPCRQVATLALACKLRQGSDKGVPNRNHAACGEPSQPKVRNERPNVHSQQVGTADAVGPQVLCRAMQIVLFKKATTGLRPQASVEPT